MRDGHSGWIICRGTDSLKVCSDCANHLLYLPPGLQWLARVLFICVNHFTATQWTIFLECVCGEGGLFTNNTGHLGSECLLLSIVLAMATDRPIDRWLVSRKEEAEDGTLPLGGPRCGERAWAVASAAALWCCYTLFCVCSLESSLGHGSFNLRTPAGGAQWGAVCVCPSHIFQSSEPGASMQLCLLRLVLSLTYPEMCSLPPPPKRR